MKKRILLLTFLAATAWSAPQPNIIVIMADDLGSADVGFQGSTRIPTPHLDGIRKRGVRFTDGHVTASVCSPSRAGLMMGRYQQRFGHHANVPPKANGMDPNETTLAEALKPLGYTTGFIGKWHLGETEERYPTNQGFDQFIGLRQGHRSFWYDEKKYDKKGSHYAIEHNGEQIKFEGYLTDRFGDWAVDFIHEQKDQPFFLYVSFTAPHGPLHAKDEDLETLKTDSKYDAMIYNMDLNIGKIVAALDNHKLSENTLVWFLSDNGGITGASSNAPYTGKKGSAFEGGQRVPFILSWPGVTQANSTDDRLMSALDIFPTCLKAAGGDPSANPRPLDGVDLKPFLMGKQRGAIHDRLFWQRENIAGIRTKDWKLIQVVDQGIGLFNLSNEPAETNNVAKAHIERAQSLATELEQWMSTLSEPTWYEGKGWLPKRAAMHSKEYTATVLPE